MNTGYEYAPEVIADARAWIADVVSDPEAVEDAPVADILAFVAANYEGGIGAFVRDGMYPEAAEHYADVMAGTADRYAAAGYGVIAAHLRDAARAQGRYTY